MRNRTTAGLFCNNYIAVGLIRDSKALWCTSQIGHLNSESAALLGKLPRTARTPNGMWAMPRRIFEDSPYGVAVELFGLPRVLLLSLSAGLALIRSPKDRVDSSGHHRSQPRGFHLGVPVWPRVSAEQTSPQLEHCVALNCVQPVAMRHGNSCAATTQERVLQRNVRGSNLPAP